MSIPPSRVNKSAAKRRAERRRRTREIGRHVFAYGVIALLVLGTVSSVILPPLTTPTGQVVPTIAPTQPAAAGFEQLVTLGDQAIVAGDPLSAYGYYSAYLSNNPNDQQVASKAEGALNSLPAAADRAVAAGQWLTATNMLDTYARARSTDADAQLKLAKTILSSPQPDYVQAAAALERATKIPNSPVLAEAQALLQQHQPAIQTAVAAAPLTGTVGITSTVLPSATLTTTTPASPTLP